MVNEDMPRNKAFGELELDYMLDIFDAWCEQRGIRPRKSFTQSEKRQAYCTLMMSDFLDELNAELARRKAAADAEQHLEEVKSKLLEPAGSLEAAAVKEEEDAAGGDRVPLEDSGA